MSILLGKHLFRIKGVLGGVEQEEQIGPEFVKSHYYMTITNFICLAMKETVFF